MKKIGKALVLLFLLASLFASGLCVKGMLVRRDWKKANCIITFIGLPDGTVFGTYTDCNGTVHTDEALFTDIRFQGHKGDVANVYGSEIPIRYDLQSGAVQSENAIKMGNLFCFLWLCLSMILALIVFRKPKNA